MIDGKRLACIVVAGGRSCEPTAQLGVLQLRRLRMGFRRVSSPGPLRRAHIVPQLVRSERDVRRDMGAGGGRSIAAAGPSMDTGDMSPPKVDATKDVPPKDREVKKGLRRAVSGNQFVASGSRREPPDRQADFA